MNSELTQGFGAIENAVVKHYGIPEGALRGRGAMPPISGTTPVSVPVANGSGSFTTPEKTTWGVTITGTVTITAPSGGTWSIQVVDQDNDNAVVFNQSGMVAGTSYPFGPYGTAFHSLLNISAVWSESANTTLQATIDYQT